MLLTRSKFVWGGWGSRIFSCPLQNPFAFQHPLPRGACSQPAVLKLVPRAFCFLPSLHSLGFFLDLILLLYLFLIQYFVPMLQLPLLDKNTLLLNPALQQPGENLVSQTAIRLFQSLVRPGRALRWEYGQERIPWLLTVTSVTIALSPCWLVSPPPSPCTQRSPGPSALRSRWQEKESRRDVFLGYF